MWYRDTASIYMASELINLYIQKLKQKCLHASESQEIAV